MRSTRSARSPTKTLPMKSSKEGKAASELDKFRYNDYEVWKKNFTEFGFLKAIQADCSKFDFSTIAPIKLAFLDVDLYLPTRNALPNVYDQLLEGGVILVDDVTPNQHFDGSYQAYMEFVEKLGKSPISAEVVAAWSGRAWPREPLSSVVVPVSRDESGSARLAPEWAIDFRR